MKQLNGGVRKIHHHILDCGCGNTGSRSGDRINLARVRHRLDELQDQGELNSAERMLDYWLNEARMTGDEVGEIEIENEFIGFFRKNGRNEEAMKHADRALFLVKRAGMDSSITGATTRINAATACVAFQQPERGWKLFCEAKPVYESMLPSDDGRLAGLYNNMGLAAAELGKYEKAAALYDSAFRIMKSLSGGAGEAAITCLNLADAVYAEAEDAGDEERKLQAAAQIEDLMEQAWTLLQSPDLPRDSNDRFICEKCAPVFGFYGYLDYEQKLIARSRPQEKKP